MNSEWAYAVAGVAFGGLVYYAAQVVLTHRAWAALAAQVALERGNLDQRITIETAGRLGLWNIGADASTTFPMMAVEGSGSPAQALVAERSRWRWALRHPRGDGTVRGV